MLTCEPSSTNNAAVPRRQVVVPRFGKWVSMLRRFSGLNQTELAREARLKIDQVRAIERGENVGMIYVQAVISTLRRIGADRAEPRMLAALDHEAFAAMVLDAPHAKLPPIKAAKEASAAPSTLGTFRGGIRRPGEKTTEARRLKIRR